MGQDQGQALRQLEQSLKLPKDPPLATQNWKHLPTSTGNLKMPIRLEIEVGSAVRSPRLMALAGHEPAHMWHFSQNLCIPKSIGWSGCKGRSVSTLQSL